MLGRFLSKLRRKLKFLMRLDVKFELLQETLGRIESRQLQARAPATLADSEFTVFSQRGEDGILDHLVRSVPIARPIFIEFGVEDYTESNTRFLLAHRNWAGLVMDGSARNVAFIRSDPIYWRHNLKAVQAFVTRENVNALFTENGISGEIGLLSIDIDGNDYWVWESIDVVHPAIVAVEYNHRFGPTRAVAVPYDPAFSRARAHPSWIYFGASLSALTLLARRKGYSLVGCNAFGVNAFFVRDDLRPPSLPSLTAAEAFVAGKSREVRDATGSLVALSPEEEQRILAPLPVVEIA